MRLKKREQIMKFSQLPHTRSCFVCGEANPAGLNLRFETDGTTITARFVADERHIGFKGTVHGGIIGAVLDEVMVWASALHSRQFAYCAELSVRFILPVKPGEAFTAVGELTGQRRQKLFLTKAELRSSSGLAHASAVGKYIPVKAARFEELASDFVGNCSWLFERKGGPIDPRENGGIS